MGFCTIELKFNVREYLCMNIFVIAINNSHWYVSEHSGDWFLDQFDGLIFNNSVFGKKRENLCNQNRPKITSSTETPTTATNVGVFDHNTKDFQNHDVTNDTILEWG